jgi:hypothetical protein
MAQRRSPDRTPSRQGDGAGGLPDLIRARPHAFEEVESAPDSSGSGSAGRASC